MNRYQSIDVRISKSYPNISEKVLNCRYLMFAKRLPSLAAMERSGIAVKCKALLDAPFYPTISRAT